MIVLDVIKLVCKNLGFDELLETTTLGGQTEPNLENTKQIAELVDCINDVTQSVGFMYLPLRTFENISVTDKKFLFSNFSKTPIELLYIKNQLGIKQKFYTYPTFFTCDDGVYTACYTYVPKFLTLLTDTIEISNKVDARTLSYGVVARLFLLKGLFSEANAWDARFQQALLVASRKSGSVKMCGRWWT